MKKTILSITMIICSVVAAMAAANTAQFIAYVADANDATSKDMSIYLENASYTPAFNNKGEDATKMARVAGKPYVYTLVEGKVCGSTGTNDLEGTFIVVCTTAAAQYTFSFASVDGRDLYLKDHVTNTFTLIKGTNTYTFSAAANSTLADRFEITAEAPEVFFHDRAVAAGNWGTICYPELITSVEGAEVFEIAGRNADATQIAVVEVAVTDMVKGKPYLFNATDAAQKFFYNPTETAELQAGDNGLTGTFEQSTLGTDGYYVVKGQSFIPALGTSAVLANRAYLAMTDIAAEMSEYVPQVGGAPVRFFSVGRGAATDEMRIESGEMKMNGKYLINGKFVIVKDGKTTNVLGFGL